MDLIEVLYHVKQTDALRNEEGINFLGHCFTNVKSSNSQNFQDIWALYEQNFSENGFFVEFGATDGKTGSNTFLLQDKYHWSGILAEPNPVWHEKLEANRKDILVSISHECVYTETGKIVNFLATDEPDLSTIEGFGSDDEHTEKRKNAKVIPVETITLFDLLKKHKAPPLIDYISVDTEGSEFDILEKFFSENVEYRVDTFTVEHNNNRYLRDKIHDLMKKNGYKHKFMEFSRWDDFYKREIQ